MGLLILFFYWQNNSIVTSTLTIGSSQLPQSFDGYKIVQLSDLHNKSFGSGQTGLIAKIEKEKPDVIFITGDVIDSRRYDEEPSLILMEKLVQMAPVYFVTGNHEWHSGRFESLEEKLIARGVNVLRNTSAEITEGTDQISLIGIDDPAESPSYEEIMKLEESIIASLEKTEGKDGFQILLSHRPEMLSLYEKYKFDLVFSGHAHGGQVRIPFVGGLVAPNQGLFPKYTSGKYKAGGTTMIVNRGLGNSVIPIRIFNRPEIIAVTLQSEK